MSKSPERILADLQAATAKAEDVLSQVRGVQKDMRREAKELTNEVEGFILVWRATMEATLREMMTEEWRISREHLRDVIKASEVQINQQFGHIRDLVASLAARGAAGEYFNGNGIEELHITTRTIPTLMSVQYDDDDQGRNGD